MDDHLSVRAGIPESRSCALLWLDEDDATPSYRYWRYILPLVSTWWPRLFSLVSLMPLCLKMSSTHQMKNKSSDCEVISHSLMLSYCNILHLLISGRISSILSFLVANYPPCWPHSDPVDYLGFGPCPKVQTLFSDGEIFYSWFAVSMRVEDDNFSKVFPPKKIGR